MKKSILLITLLSLSTAIFAQELNCNITVHDKQIESTNKHVFENMRKDVMEFMRNNNWTEITFLPEERIECNFYITIESTPSADKFEATIQVSSVRPIYGTNYNSPMMNHRDKDFTFEYVEFQKIEFQEGSFQSNLSSVLAYYAYMILGFDFDSYSKFGGTPYFLKAQEIVQQAQGKAPGGWDGFSTDKNNRYWLVDQLLDTRFKPLREAIYRYHRLGLDKLATEPDEARHEILDSLTKLKSIEKDEPNSYLLRVFLGAKRDEIIKIFKKATETEKQELLTLMKVIDGANVSKYSDGLKE